jgi:hypothetical protein
MSTSPKREWNPAPLDDVDAVDAPPHRPTQSPDRSPHDMLPPSAEDTEAPGRTGLAAEASSEPATHRNTPEGQNPMPSERFFPRVTE